MAAYVSICDAPNCRISIEGKLARCPKCAGPVRHVRQAQPRGWVLLIVGLLLVLMMGAVTFYTAPLMLRPGEETGGSRFDGTAGQALLILGLFALLIGFGLAAVLGGLHEIVTGRQHPVFLRVMFLTFVLLMVAGLVIRIALS